MLKNAIGWIFFLVLMCGCETQEKKHPQNSSDTVEALYKNAIKQEVLKSMNDPKFYEERSWSRLESSDVISKRLEKNAIFIRHTFKEKNIFGGTFSKNNIYFIGDSKPIELLDFDPKSAFEEFLSNKNIALLFAKKGWDFDLLKNDYKKSSTDKMAKERVKALIYAISTFEKEEQTLFIDTISNINNPLSIAKNTALFLNMRSFPELIEELLFNEITYNYR